MLLSTLLGGAFRRLWGYLLAAGAFVALVVSAYLRGAASARAEAERRALKETINAANIRARVDDSVRAEPDPVGRLRSWLRD